MRRLIVLPAALLLLSSCAMKSDIAPDEVLKRSGQANQTLESAAFDLDFLVRIPSAAGTTVVDAAVSGVMQNGGQQLMFDLEAEGTSAAGTVWNTLAQFVVAGKSEAYVKLDSLEMNPAPAALTEETQASLTDTWWLIPSAGPSGTADVTPDPRMLQMQTEVIDVTRDRGIVTLGGDRVHHYDVAVNNTKLATFLSSVDSGSGQTVDPAVLEAQLRGIDLTGEMWIDAESYILRRAEWQAESPLPGGDPILSLTVNITDHNGDVMVAPPAEFEPLPVASPLQALPLPTF